MVSESPKGVPEGFNVVLRGFMGGSGDPRVTPGSFKGFKGRSRQGVSKMFQEGPREFQGRFWGVCISWGFMGVPETSLI